MLTLTFLVLSYTYRTTHVGTCLHGYSIVILFVATYHIPCRVISTVTIYDIAAVDNNIEAVVAPWQN